MVWRLRRETNGGSTRVTFLLSWGHRGKGESLNTALFPATILYQNFLLLNSAPSSCSFNWALPEDTERQREMQIEQQEVTLAQYKGECHSLWGHWPC